MAAEGEAHSIEQARAQEAARLRESEHEKEIERPCIFKSISPAWSNANLTRLAEKIRSPLVFAHVRASTMAGARRLTIVVVLTFQQAKTIAILGFLIA